MAGTLQPEDQISHYRVVGPLALGVPPGKGRALWIVTSGAALVGLAGLAFGIYGRLGSREAQAAAHPALQT